LKENPSLMSAIKKFEISSADKAFHRALNDAYFTAEILQILSKKNINFSLLKMEYKETKPKGKFIDGRYIRNKKYISNMSDILKLKLKQRVHCPKCGKFVKLVKLSRTEKMFDSTVVITYKISECNKCNLNISNKIIYNTKTKEMKEQVKSCSKNNKVFIDSCLKKSN